MKTSNADREERVEHTPTPWSFHETHEMSQSRWYVITDAQGYGPIVEVGGTDKNGQIAEAKYLVTDPAKIRANAELICRAVNSHEALVSALRAAIGVFECYERGLDSLNVVRKAHESASAALQAADLASVSPKEKAIK